MTLQGRDVPFHYQSFMNIVDFLLPLKIIFHSIITGEAGFVFVYVFSVFSTCSFSKFVLGTLLLELP